VDDLREVRVVADDEDPAVRRDLQQQLPGGIAVEPRGQRVGLDRREAEGLAGQPRGLQRADLRAGVDGLERELERGQGASRGARLRLAPLRELPVVVGARLVRLGLCVPQQPQLGRHGC
jgi:hypothetical protein